MIKKIVHKVKHKLWVNSIMATEEDKLHNAMILALVLGIIITVATLIFIRPPPEYFTELYFPNPNAIPQIISPDKLYSFDLTIANHEKEEHTYNLEVSAIIENDSVSIYKDNIVVGKEQQQNLTIPYSISNFKKAKIMASLLDKDQEVYFFIFNSNASMNYPDTIAFIDCVKEFNITPDINFVISAKGTFGPKMKVRVNGKQVYSTQVNNTEFQNFTIWQSLGNNDVLDIVFDNDFYDKAKDEDRNLYIDYVKIDKLKILSKQMTGDSGIGASAFNCEDIKPIYNGLPWNGALRAKFKEKK